jgi:hypothetical protein
MERCKPLLGILSDCADGRQTSLGEADAVYDDIKLKVLPYCEESGADAVRSLAKRPPTSFHGVIITSL